MKKIIIGMVLMFSFAGMAYCQTPDEKEVAATVEIIRKAIVDADKNVLEAVSADGLVYAHSAGRVQDKAEFIDEIVSGEPFDYTSVTITDQTIRIIDNTAIVRHIYSAETLANGKPGSLKIGNMMILQKQDGKWKLIARQAYRL
ncbi:MAG: nuclear transport factor 2 family protein [Bacteroidales bacterium]|nr:nuclear transport factor 2 family protein [Bacteroidales bacterium]